MSFPRDRSINLHTSFSFLTLSMTITYSKSFFNRIYSLYCTCDVLPIYMSVYRMCAWCPQRSGESIQQPGAGVMYVWGVVSRHVDAGDPTWSSEEQQVPLTTELPLWPCVFCFFICLVWFCLVLLYWNYFMINIHKCSQRGKGVFSNGQMVQKKRLGVLNTFKL